MEVSESTICILKLFLLTRVYRLTKMVNNANVYIMTQENPDRSSMSLKEITEADRTPEFIEARAQILQQVDGMFASLEDAKNRQDRQFKFGGAVFGMLGVQRVIVPGVDSRFNHMIEYSKNAVGLFVAPDNQNGHDVIVLNRPDKSRVEIRRDPLLSSVILPEDPATPWETRPKGVNSHEILVSINETQEDGGSVGYDVTASGVVVLRRRDQTNDGMNYSRNISPHDAESVRAAMLLLNAAEQDFFIDDRQV